jgi:hypothetical protein
LRRLTPEITMLTKTSSNLTDRQYLYLCDRNMDVVFSANYSAAALQWIHGVSTRTSVKGKLQQSVSPKELGVPDDILQINVWNIPLVNNVTSWCHFQQEGDMETPHWKDCSQDPEDVSKDLFSIQKWALSANRKLTLYNALTYACPTWEHAVDAHILKLQLLQNRVLCCIGNLDRCIQSANCMCL